ncbi:hypothetical protein [Dyadobacter arcticus]|uniref:DUF5004 domain-containing protein n=1 Tax=Dyadobacter arcticus TaxID=1078754 RepID=A0ABX0UKV9_9BACT|nr:hypothetical protein [Dyadobacter arcticus]NIJ53633.1 hypothetical protein [Dyadobacter arcticus]
MFKKTINFCLLLLLATGFLQACSQSAKNPKEASEHLTASPKWMIDEITVNDVVTFKDGQMTQQFGGIVFERYMETVMINKDGTFSGNFKGEAKPFVMKWTATNQEIKVGLPDAAPQTSSWIILPKDVTNKSFIMKVKSSAYDYPRMTSIALKFKAGG